MLRTRRLAVDQIDAQHVRELARVVALLVELANGVLAVVVQNGLQRGAAGGGQELPVDAFAAQVLAEIAHDFRTVAFRVEGHGQQPRGGGDVRALAELGLQFMEHGVGERAAVDVGAAGVDEAEQHQTVAHQVGQLRRTAVFQQHIAVGGGRDGRQLVGAGGRGLVAERAPAGGQNLPLRFGGGDGRGQSGKEPQAGAERGGRSHGSGGNAWLRRLF